MSHNEHDLRLYTFGYQGRTPEELDHERQRLNALIVDIRLIPKSKIPGWSLEQLQERFGPSYVWIRELGNTAKGTGKIVLADEPEGLMRLCRLWYERAYVCRVGAVILLCACVDLEKCHRKYLADRVAAFFGEEVVEHLRPAVRAVQERMVFA